MSVCDALRLAGGTDMDSPIPLSALLPRCVNHYSGPLSPEKIGRLGTISQRFLWSHNRSGPRNRESSLSVVLGRRRNEIADFR